MPSFEVSKPTVLPQAEAHSISKFFVSYLRAAYVQMISERSYPASSIGRYTILIYINVNMLEFFY